MQSKISFFNPTVCKKNLTRFWPFALLYLVYLIIAHPLVIYTSFNQLIYYSSDMTAESLVYSHFVEMTEPVSIFLAAIVMAIAVFGYLYQSRSANMIHTLPVTRTQLYVTNYVSGLLLLIIPQFLGALLTNLVILDRAADTTWIVWGWFGVTAGETLFFYSFAVLMVMFTGQLLAAGLFYLIWNFLYIVTVFLIDGMGTLFFYGMSDNLIGTNAHPLFPLFYLIRKVGFDRNSLTGEVWSKGFAVLLAYMLVGVVFAVLAWWIYEHRRIECAGDFLSMKWTAPVFRWGVVLVGGIGCALFVTYIISDYSSWNMRVARFVIALILFSVALFFASEMFIEKSFRVFHKRMIVECVSCVAVLLVGTALLHFDVFGVESYVPQAENVAMVCVQWEDREVDFEDPEKIGEVTALHQLMVDHLDEQKKYTDGNGNETAPTDEIEQTFVGYVSIDYTMKNGKAVKRNYYSMAKDQSYAEQVDGQLQAFAEDEDGFLSSVLGLNYKELDWKPSYAYVSLPVVDPDGNWYYGDSETDISDPRQLQKLYEAWLADVKAGAFAGDDGSPSVAAELNLQFETKADLVDIRYPSGSLLSYRLDYYDTNGGVVSNSTNIYLNDRCTHLIQALVDIGAVKNAGDLNVSVE